MNRQQLVAKFSTDELAEMRAFLVTAVDQSSHYPASLPRALDEAHYLVNVALRECLYQFDTDEPEPSPPIRLLAVMWEGSMRATGHSWSRLNAAMHQTLHAAIIGGLKFDLDDFAVIAKRFRFQYWGGADNDKNFGEHFYSAACTTPNLSACHAWEHFRGRKPFLVGGHRLHLRSDLLWEGIRTEVTSFDDVSGTITCCGGYPEAGTYPRKPTRVFTLTPAQLRAAYPARKPAKEAVSD